MNIGSLVKVLKNPIGTLVYFAFERFRTRDGRRFLSTNLYRGLAKWLNKITYRRFRAQRTRFLQHYLAGYQIELCDSFMKDGWAFEPAGSLPEVAGLVEAARAIFDAEGEYKGIDVMPYPIASPEQLLREEAIYNFVTSDQLIYRACLYLGEYPVLTNISLVRSDPRPARPWEASQNLHLDIIDTKVFRVIVHITDVDETNGPFSFYPLSTSTRLRRDKTLNYGSSLVDLGIRDEQLPDYTEGQLEVVTGPAGSVLFVDSSNCFHLGSRATERARCVFMLTYTSLAIENMRAAMGLDDLSGAVKPTEEKEQFLLNRRYLSN